MIKSASCKNFKCFDKISFEFSDGINVFIGDNGTGKTTILDLIFTACGISKNNSVFLDKKNDEWSDPAFKSEWRLKQGKDDFEIKVYKDNIETPLVITGKRGECIKYKGIKEWSSDEYNGICLETFLSYNDLCDEGESFGINRIDNLTSLLKDDTLNNKTVIIIDGAEIGISSSRIPELVDILLEIQRRNVQIFISTHSYMLSKYLEVKQTFHDPITFFSLYKEDDQIKCESSPEFRTLDHNPIIESYNILLNQVYGNFRVG